MRAEFWIRGVGSTGCDARRARGDYETEEDGGGRGGGERRTGEGRGRKGGMNERSIDI